MVSVSVSKLKTLCNPFIHSPWGVKVSQSKVRKALEDKNFLSKPIENIEKPNSRDHAARIAYFVAHGFEDPISIDVGIPSIGYTVDWVVVDGNHRLSAAIFQNSETITAEFSGEVEFFRELFNLPTDDLH